MPKAGFLMFLIGSILLVSGVVEAADIGGVTREQGTSHARLGTVERPLDTGAVVRAQERLVTGTETRLEVTFADQSVLTLGDNADILLDSMVYDPTSGSGDYVLTVSSGVFRMVTGAINKSGGSLTVQTPVATIGIRGTDFWGLQEEDRLTMALLDDGELVITSPQGQVVLTEPGESVVISRGEQPGPVVILDADQIAAAAQTVAF